MLKKELKDNIQILENVSDWEEAIKIASKPLLEKKKIEERYIQAMIDNIKEMGPYIVLMPRVAMPHSRPQHGVLESCMALLKLNKGVSFSSKKEDVNLVFILGAKDSNSHVDLLVQLSDLLEEEENVNNMIKAKSVDEIFSLI
ncbi:PTS sugar transporter subunit IIA [uncultured Ilyobacter sp.]|uniref:PTS sugar transporter subunit IIA n=1 Tax=uncultured Ilyobacter sp. TaxID=544433 RepID=UPI0029C7CEF9|nr:PTS sugar transporter subunit IIA [uncultured Ilyobacter sp.]